jgi:uncharacterized membrane protein
MNATKNSHWTATERDRRNQRNIIYWSLAWIVPFLGTNLAITNEWIEGDALALAATAGVTGLGLGVLLAYRRFLSNADELMRKIQLDALALTVGVGVVSGFSYTLLERAEIVTEADAMTLIMVMVVTYIIGIVVGLRRFA